MYFIFNRYHGPQKWKVSLYCSQGLVKPHTWDPHSPKVSKWAGKAQNQMFAHQQQDSTDSYKYLLCASSFETHKALVCCGAAVSLTHKEHRRISLQEEQRITGFVFSSFFLNLLLLHNKKIYRCYATHAGCTDVYQNYYYWDSVFCIRLDFLI